MSTFYHGGAPGLKPGDTLRPSPPHVEDGCPVCVARAEGRSLTVGEFKDWLRTQGPRALPVLWQLEDAPDGAPVDPPSATKAVYITSDPLYAAWYAARSGNGDLYRVKPLGLRTPSPEDHFPTWTVPAARVVEVVRRRVVLTERERRELDAAWRVADERAAMEQGAA